MADYSFRSRDNVFVLGAGASFPYGFPLGNQLKGQILKELEAQDVRQQFMQADFKEREMDEFKADLKYAYTFSTLDQYLAGRSDHREIGAFAIVRAIANSETENHFDADDWYKKFASALRLHEGDAPSYVRAVISFNYDRSLRHFLHRVAFHCHAGKERARALAKLESIPFLHLHGSVGLYPNHGYGPVKNMQHLRALSTRLGMIHEDDVSNSSDYVAARAHIANAEHIHILGWAFDERGVRRLGLRDQKLQGGRRMSATAFQLPIMNDLRQSFGQSIYLCEKVAKDYMDEMLHH